MNIINVIYYSYTLTKRISPHRVESQSSFEIEQGFSSSESKALLGCKWGGMLPIHSTFFAKMYIVSMYIHFHTYHVYLFPGKLFSLVRSCTHSYSNLDLDLLPVSGCVTQELRGAEMTSCTCEENLCNSALSTKQYSNIYQLLAISISILCILWTRH